MCCNVSANKLLLLILLLLLEIVVRRVLLLLLLSLLLVVAVVVLVVVFKVDGRHYCFYGNVLKLPRKGSWETSVAAEGEGVSKCFRICSGFLHTITTI